MDANCQGQDGDAANGEMIQKTANEKEKEKERAMLLNSLISLM